MQGDIHDIALWLTDVIAEGTGVRFVFLFLCLWPLALFRRHPQESRIGLKALTERYRAFCKKRHYIFQPDKPEKLFNASKELVAVFPKEKTCKLLIQQSKKTLDFLLAGFL